ncbi:MAG: Acetyl-CoA:oxalate CoA-transferase [Alphaproteobacteria bacterium MarineAlpha4_Bin2]|nr:MAG: Acetyl-CoA:oxalate CoA-transferase [Alphaproteobacteria bacterium MarineAlpha4_Bin2]
MDQIDKRPETALSKVRVLDLGRVLAGPYCGQILGDMGAEVIKVEHPERGDDTRAWKPPAIGDDAAYFCAVNRNKRSIGIDLATNEGRKLLLELAKNSDVFIENFRPGVTKRLGIDYAEVARVNPQLIYCSISGFGQKGPLAQRAAYDYVVQATAGIIALTGEPERIPVRCAGAISDYGTGLWSVVAVLFALMERDRTGQGQHIDMAMNDTTMLYLSHVAAMYFADGLTPNRVGNGHEKIVPTDVYQTKDEPLMVLCGNDAMFERLAKAVGRPDMIEDKRFRTNIDRSANLGPLGEIMREAMLKDTRSSWEKRLSDADVAFAPIRSIEEAYTAEDVAERDMIMELQHGSGETFRVLGSPLKMSESSVNENPLPPPMLGEHSEEILRDVLGLNDDDIDALQQSGVINATC